MATTITQRAQTTGGSTGHQGRTTAPGTVPRRKPNRAHRRQWLAYIATCKDLRPSDRAWLLLLAKRSDDGGKPVWGSQVRMGEQVGRCERSIRYYRARAEGAGLIRVIRADPERGPDGCWRRPRSNVYVLTFPKADQRVAAAHTDRQRVAVQPLQGVLEQPPSAGNGAVRREPGELAARKPPPVVLEESSRPASEVPEIAFGDWAGLRALCRPRPH